MALRKDNIWLCSTSDSFFSSPVAARKKREHNGAKHNSKLFSWGGRLQIFMVILVTVFPTQKKILSNKRWPGSCERFPRLSFVGSTFGRTLLNFVVIDCHCNSIGISKPRKSDAEELPNENFPCATRCVVVCVVWLVIKQRNVRLAMQHKNSSRFWKQNSRKSIAMRVLPFPMMILLEASRVFNWNQQKHSNVAIAFVVIPIAISIEKIRKESRSLMNQLELLIRGNEFKSRSPAERAK